MTSQLGHIDMTCDVCGEPIPFGHAISFVLNNATLVQMHMNCYAAGALWAAKMARAEPPSIDAGGGGE